MLYWKSILGILLSILMSAQAFSAPSNLPRKIVMITQIVEHPALTAVRKGVIETLRQNGFDPAATLELHYENAQGNIATAAQISQKFVGGNPDVIVAISTPSAQTMVSAARGQFPVVFAAVTDPVAANIVKSLDKPEAPVTGVIDRAPFEAQLALIQQIMGNKKRLGVLYNAGEINSVTALDILRKEAQKLGIDIIETNAARSSEIGTAAQNLANKVDAIFIPNDNTAVSSLDTILKACEDAKIPLFAADIMLVERGVLATIGFDYTQMGVQTGNLVVKILNGADPRQLPVEIPTQQLLYINTAAAKKINLNLPAEIVKKADKVF